MVNIRAARLGDQLIVDIPLAGGGTTSLPMHLLSDVLGNPISPTNGLAITDGYQAPQIANWTSATAVNTPTAVLTAGYDGVMVSVATAAGITGGALIFEAYDGSTWLPCKIFSLSSYTGIQTLVLAAAMAVGFQADIAGCPQFRVRLLAAITGAGNVTVTQIVTSAPLVPGVTVGLDPLQPLPPGTNALGTVSKPLTAAPIAGQQLTTVGAVALPAGALVGGVRILASAANAAIVYVGGAGVTVNTGCGLSPGQFADFAVTTLAALSIIGLNTTDKISWAA